LFLSAGSIIHTLGGEQDMRKMGGMRKITPVTFIAMSSGVFAICGIFPFAGFFSKDAILFEAFRSPNGGLILWFVGLVAAFFTSFYMFRLWYLTFWGKSRFTAPKESHGHALHESSWVMLAPLVILGILSLTGGWMGWPEALHGNDWFAHFLEPALNNVAPAVDAANAGTGSGLNVVVLSQHVVEQTTPQLERVLSGLAMLVAALGWFMADTFYRRSPELPGRIAASFGGITTLLVRKYWVDELYLATIVRPLLLGSRFVLGGVVEGAVVQGGGKLMSGSANGAGAVVRRIQSGRIRSYAGWLALGAAAVLLLSYFGFGSGAASSWVTHFKIW
jgi:NADH-quinone oxidoreductase subunit L